MPKVHKCVQGSDEWWELHRGRATASSFDKIITPKQGKLSASVDDLIAELAAQIIFPKLPIAPLTYISPAMQNGIAMEPEARRWYESHRNTEVEQVGFIETDCGRFGCSPDALIAEDFDGPGGLELKCPLPKTHIRYLLDDELPSEYRCQVHGELLVTGRAWFDFVSYCHGLPPFIKRVKADDFTLQLSSCLEQFHAKFVKVMMRLQPQEAPHGP